LTEELGIRKVCAKMVSRNLTEQKLDARLNVCADLLEKVEADPQVKNRFISGEESCFFFPYDLGTKRQSLECQKSKHVLVKSEIHTCVLL
jgi:hypothetical protein